MAKIDILNLQPSVISRDLRQKYMLLYGREKCGKTTFASQAEGVLLCAFEAGTNAISGKHIISVDTWSTFKSVVNQLKKAEAKEKYKVIAIDTVALAYTCCESYVCNALDVTSIGDAGFGKGWTFLKKELEETFRQITLMGYGLIFLAHSSSKTLKINAEDGTEVETVYPTLPNIAKDIVNKLVDIISYITIEYTPDGQTETGRYINTKGNQFILAGSRYPYLAEKIPLSYKEFEKALINAIEKQEKLDGAVVIDEPIQFSQEEKRPFEEVMNEAKELWEKIRIALDSTDALNSIVRRYFGQSFKLSQALASQQDLVSLCIEDFQTLIEENNIQ